MNKFHFEKSNFQIILPQNGFLMKLNHGESNQTREEKNNGDFFVESNGLEWFFSSYYRKQ